MTILDRYFGARVLSTFLKTVVSLVLLFVLVDLLTHRRSDIDRYDVPWGVVITYYAARVPDILYRYQVAALSVLVSGLLVLGNAAQNNEITAALTGGISLWRLVRMPIVVAAGIAVALFAAQDTFGARANVQVKKLEERYFPSSAQYKRNGVSFPRLAGGWTCHMMKFNRTALTGEGILMHSFRDDAVEQILARRMYWDETAHKWFIEDGGWLVLDPKKDWQGPVNRITRQEAPIQESPEDLFALEEPADTKNAATLLSDIRRAEARGMPVAASWTDFYAKFAQPALCFVIIGLAIPFAMRIRRGGLAIGFGVSISMALAYLVVFRIAMSLGHAGRLSPPLAAWLANLMFLALGLFLIRKTPT